MSADRTTSEASGTPVAVLSARVRLILESSVENAPLWPECCIACRDEVDAFVRDDHDEDCPHALHAKAFVALDALVLRHVRLTEALRAIQRTPCEHGYEAEVERIDCCCGACQIERVATAALTSGRQA